MRSDSILTYRNFFLGIGKKDVKDDNILPDGSINDPREKHRTALFTGRNNVLYERGLAIGAHAMAMRMGIRRDWSILSGVPVVRKTVSSMAADGMPIIEHVQLGSITMIFVGTQLVGFTNGNTRLLLASNRASGIPGEFQTVETYSELVKRLYLSLANHSRERVEHWIDGELDVQGR